MSDSDEMLTFMLDGQAVEASPGELVIAAAERAGTYIPRFCWHPRMKPVGMCRMCLVELEGPRGPSLTVSCMLAAADGMVVRTDSPAVKKAQDGVLEFLLINHPLDCPVCDRGGECPLQDQTLTYGPGESRFIEEKRHFAKPVPISDLVLLDRERCIQCARCTRFADEVAGDPLINFVERGGQIQVLTFPDEPFKSYFSGNTVQICPVGALLASPYRFRARPWDLEQVESTCTSCAVGCRVTVQSSSNRLVRYLGTDSDPVNHGWLCDKGRFDFEAVNHDDRLGQPLVRGAERELGEASWGEALDVAAQALGQRGPVAVLGGSRLANEDAYAWAKLAKGVIGTDHVDCQLGDGLQAELVLGLPRATIDQACSAAAVVLLAPDLKEELPVLYLRLREAAVDHQVRIVELTPQATGLTRHAAASLLYRPGEAAAVARSLTAALGEGQASEAGGVAAASIESAAAVLRDVGDGPVVVVLGRPSVTETGGSVCNAARVLAAGLREVRFLPALRRANVHGALDMGLAPGVLPGRVSLDDGRAWFEEAWGSVPAERGEDAIGILRAVAGGDIGTLVLLGADPLNDFPDRALARRALDTARFVVAVDLFLTDSARRADVVLPAAGYAEREGTTTNLEGRVSRLGQKVTGPGTARPDWVIAVELALRLGGDLGFESLSDIWDEIERLAPSHQGLTSELLSRPEYRDGVVVPVEGEPAVPPAAHLPQEAAAVGQGGSVSDVPPEPEEERASEAVKTGPEAVADPESAAAIGTEGEAAAARADHDALASAPDGSTAPHGGEHRTDSGRPRLLELAPDDGTGTDGKTPPLDAYSLRLVSGRSLYDLGTLAQHSPSLARLTPGPRLRANPADLDRLGVRTGGQVRLTSSRGSTILRVTADTGVPRGSAAITFNQPEAGVADLIDATDPVTDVRLETV